jgi:hypothetical protein
MESPAYSIIKAGIWPNEVYSIGVSASVINPDLGVLPAENFLRFVYNPNIPISYLMNFDYRNTSYNSDGLGLYNVNTQTNSTLVWNVSAERRSYNIGNTLNSFSINKNKSDTNPLNKNYYNYLVYPNRLALVPTGKPTFNGTNWSLITKTVLLSQNTFFYNSSSSNFDAANQNLAYATSNPTTEAIPSNPNYSLFFNVCACRTRVNVPLFTFTDTYNPAYFSTILENTPSTVDKCQLRPYSTYVTYDVSYYAMNETLTYHTYSLGQARPDTMTGLLPTFKSSYILNYTPPSTIQTFQLVQIKADGTSTDLSDPSYSVLNAIFDLSSSNFKYVAKSFQLSNQTIISSVTGRSGTPISVSYIADCPTMQFSLERWQDTIYSVNTPLGVAVPTNALPATVTWTTKYPPHYYSLKASLSGSAESSSYPFLESSELTWFLYSSAVSAGYTTGNYTTSITLSTFFSSDYNFISYDLPSNAFNDFIKFTPITGSNSTAFLSALSCFYGNNLNQLYSLVDTPWIPAASANNFMITYPNLTFGQIDFSLRPTLCSIAGYIDAWQATPIELATGQLPANPGLPIFITKVREMEDFMEVDSSFLNSTSSWPTRDLTNSYISWNFSPSAASISINAVDLSGNYIQQIPPLSAVIFGSNTWGVVLSGYGPQATTITLSSQKYNETTNLTSVSSLFNYFREGRLLIGVVPNSFDNADMIRTISLSARIPYKGRQYDLPPNVPINWTWTYDNSIDFENIPISANYIPSLNTYNYGDTTYAYQASALNFSILPPITTQIPSVHEVIFNASVDTYAGLMEGVYKLYVDDFPDKSIFNTNLGVYYTGYTQPSAQILNTSDNKFVVTRPQGTNNFTLLANSDSISYLNTGNIIWNFNNTLSYVTTSIDVSINSVGNNFVVLSALNAIAPGWTSAHNVSTQVTFYIIDPVEFNTPIQFNVLPEYFWLGGRYLTLTDQTNYTLASSPTAFNYKKSNSQAFYLSANKSNFNDYRYFVGGSTEVGSASSYYQLMEIPYVNDLTLSLTAFNDTTYPAYNGLYYKAPVGSSLVTLPFNIVANTTNNASNVFQSTPSLVPYSTITVAFTSNLSSINLDSQRVLTIFQQISTNPLESPAQLQTGTVTYTLSTSQWQVNKDVPAITGQYDIFDVVIGDPSIELNLSGTINNSLFLTASANVNVKIPSSTFKNYTDAFGFYTAFYGDRDLWSSVNQNIPSVSGSLPINAYSPSAVPELYLSTTYTLTGSPITLQFTSPYTSSKFSIVAYAVDFGENPLPVITSSNFPLSYSYKNAGTFFISYSALYDDGSIKAYQNPNPLFIKNSWNTYNPNQLRFVEEAILSLPYSSDQIMIQPNEWGDADIFNTAITRLQENLEYIIGNVQTINTNSPTVFYGWLGCANSNIGNGIRWYTKDYGSEYHLNPFDSVSNGFSDIKDIANNSNYIFVLDGGKFRVFSNDKDATEIYLNGVSDLNNVFLDPISLEIDETGTVIFVADPPKNKIYRIDLELNINSPALNYSLNVGGLGNVYDTNKFNSPSEIVYSNGNLFVLDYNNNCVKEFNKNLNWVHTYTTSDFVEDIPQNIAVHPELNLLFILTESKKFYVFDPVSSDYFSSFQIKNIKESVVKVSFDEVGDFIYIITTSNIYKYSINGYFISQMNIPNDGTIAFTSAKSASNRTLLFSTNNSIIKVQDILSIYKVGEGYPTQYWSLDQLLIDRDELAMDTNYNRSMVRIGQNLKAFRDSLNAKLVLATEQTASGVITYFSIVPISNDDKPIFDAFIESDFIGVAVNELHTPQTLNRELTKLYNAVNSLKEFMDITTYNVTGQGNSNCSEQFCWSWGAMSCYNLTLPAIRVCNVNPITYAELETNFPVSYAPSKTWGSAISDCCNNVIPPV